MPKSSDTFLYLCGFLSLDSVVASVLAAVSLQNASENLQITFCESELGAERQVFMTIQCEIKATFEKIWNC